MQGFAPAIEVSSVSYTVLVLLVNSPVHRLLKLPANVIEAQQQRSALTISTVPLLHVDRLRVSIAPLYITSSRRRLREWPNHMGSQRGATLSHIEKNG